MEQAGPHATDMRAFVCKTLLTAHMHMHGSRPEVCTYVCRWGSVSGTHRPGVVSWCTRRLTWRWNFLRSFRGIPLSRSTDLRAGCCPRRWPNWCLRSCACRRTRMLLARMSAKRTVREGGGESSSLLYGSCGLRLTLQTMPRAHPRAPMRTQPAPCTGTGVRRRLVWAAWARVEGGSKGRLGRTPN